MRLTVVSQSENCQNMKKTSPVITTKEVKELIHIVTNKN